MENKNTGMRKVLYLLLAFLVSVMIWFYVDETGPRLVEREITDIPIIYMGEDTVLADRGLMLLDEGTDATVNVTVRGGRRAVSWMDNSSIRVIAELQNVTSPGEQRVSCTFSVVRSFDDLVSIIDRSSSMATVNISELYSKTVDVKCELVGNVAEGYNAGQLQMSHTKIDIWGQQETIDQVAYAKVKLDIGNATGSVSETLDVQYYDKDGQVLDGSGIRTTVERVQVSLPVFVTKELRLTMNFIDAPGARLRNVSFRLEPETITVSGPAEILRDRETIVLDSFDLLSIGNEESRHTYAITVPEGCSNLSGVTRSTLIISYRDMVSASVATSRIRCENIPLGKHMDILTEEVPVSIFGAGADVEAITEDDITLVVDLSDFSAALGSYTVPAAVEISGGRDIGIAGAYQVQVVIREPGTEPEPDEPENPVAAMSPGEDGEAEE